MSSFFNRILKEIGRSIYDLIESSDQQEIVDNIISPTYDQWMHKRFQNKCTENDDTILRDMISKYYKLFSPTSEMTKIFICLEKFFKTGILEIKEDDR